MLLGGWPGEVEPLRAWVDARGLRGVAVRPACPEDELVRSLATCRALVLPSLEEGYGLPAFEAAAAGVPVATSRAGATGELPDGVAVHFRPDGVDEIAAALDAAVELEPAPYDTPASTLSAGVLRSLAAAVDSPR